MNKNNFYDFEEKTKIKNYINYKDLFIILSLWYLLYFLTKIVNQTQVTKHSPHLEGLLEYLLFASGRFIFIALALFYFISMYNLSLKNLKFKFNLNIKLLFQIFFLIIFLTIIIVFLINMPLILNNFSSAKFDPLYKVKSPAIFVNSLFPVLFFFIINIVTVLGEIFFLENIIKAYLYNFFGEKVAIFISSITYPFLLMIDSFILSIQFFIFAFILFILIKKDESLISAAIFGSAFYTFIFIYIYGWNIFYL